MVSSISQHSSLVSKRAINVCLQASRDHTARKNLQTAVKKAKADLHRLEAFLNTLHADLEDDWILEMVVATPDSEDSVVDTKDLEDSARESKDEENDETPRLKFESTRQHSIEHSKDRKEKEDKDELSAVIDTLKEYGLEALLMRATATYVALDVVILRPLGLSNGMSLICACVIFTCFVMSKMENIRNAAKAMNEGNEKKAANEAADLYEAILLTIILTGCAGALVKYLYGCIRYFDGRMLEIEAEKAADYERIGELCKGQKDKVRLMKTVYTQKRSMYGAEEAREWLEELEKSESEHKLAMASLKKMAKT